METLQPCPPRRRNLSWVSELVVSSQPESSGDCRELTEFPRHEGDAPDLILIHS